MTDRPILFSAEMVRAILAGRKTQTRRVIKPQPPAEAKSVSRQLCSQDAPEFDGAWQWWGGKPLAPITKPLFCPYGKPGDLLWVREGFAVQPELWADNRGPQPIHYTADQIIGFAGKPDTRQIEDYRSKPSIHMPRWASRITLRITDVRVERLQDISEDDARAEGVSRTDWEYDDGECRDTDREALSRLWNRINGAGAWEANPWVWAILFERVKP